MNILSLVRRLAPVLALLFLSGTVAAQDVAKRWAPTESASDYGYRFDELFSLITILVSVSFLIVLVLIIVPMLRDRARPGHRAHFDHGRSLHDKRFTAIVSVTVFVVLDAWVLVIAMTDLREAYWNIPDSEDPDTYHVQVLGQQWAWNFRAPGVDGMLGTADDIVTLNELHVPKDRPVSFNMTSKDVIHSLFLPDMRMKRDMNPGAINKAWFKPITAGTYDILCAELCGYAHYRMLGELYVLEQDDFDAWEQEASRMALAAYDESDLEAQWAWTWED
jgi:cytochrome c oxidase subunit 2